ncbi:MAG: CAP domain-containing protein [Thermoanaerobaculia bacterium]
MDDPAAVGRRVDGRAARGGLDRSAAGSAYDLTDEPDAPPGGDAGGADRRAGQHPAPPARSRAGVHRTGHRSLLPLLTGVADDTSEPMAIHDYFRTATSPTAPTPDSGPRRRAMTWNFVGENIAAGNSTASATMAQRMNSSGHRNNILSSNYRELGVGYYRQTGDLSNIDFDANGDCDCIDLGRTAAVSTRSSTTGPSLGRGPPSIR